MVDVLQCRPRPVGMLCFQVSRAPALQECLEYLVARPSSTGRLKTELRAGTAGSTTCRPFRFWALMENRRAKRRNVHKNRWVRIGHDQGSGVDRRRRTIWFIRRSLGCISVPIRESNRKSQAKPLPAQDGEIRPYSVVAPSIEAESEMRTNARPVLASRERGMTPWQRWVERPQVLGVRRAFFQVHLWAGIGIGLYVLLISVSGSAVVYGRELMRKYARRPIVAIQPGGRMSVEELRRRAQVHYPGFTVADAYESRRMNAPATVTLERETKRMERYFNPYTGADLGETQSEIERIVGWVVDLHAH